MGIIPYARETPERAAYLTRRRRERRWDLVALAAAALFLAWVAGVVAGWFWPGGHRPPLGP